jgi:hypothetical protein
MVDVQVRGPGGISVRGTYTPLRCFQRTRDWKWAVRDLAAGRSLAERSGGRPHIFGSFYVIVLGIEDEDGSGI